MKDDRLIQILCAQQWEKCKGELRALLALQGSTYPRYENNKASEDRCWRKFMNELSVFIEKVESQELHLGD